MNSKQRACARCKCIRTLVVRDARPCCEVSINNIDAPFGREMAEAVERGVLRDGSGMVEEAFEHSEECGPNAGPIVRRRSCRLRRLYD